MSGFDDYESYDAVGLAGLVRRGEASADELLAAAVERLEARNGPLNMVTVKMYDQARAAVAAGLPDGPLRGVPFLLKDLGVLYEGAPTTNSCALFTDFVADHDSEIVARYKRAGLVIFGRTNTPEVGFSLTTEPRMHGPTRNPWDTGRSPGGSSGGAAAAVAARVLPIAHATDGGGSIRVPASCCGVFGLKPTRGRNPAGPDLGEGMSGMSVGHAVSRSVRDNAALLDASAGPDIGDPYWAPPPARPFLDEVGADPGRLRIAVSTASPLGGPVHPDCVAAVEDAARLCRDLGHDVDEAAPDVDLDGLLDAMLVIWGGSIDALIQGRCEVRDRAATVDELEAATWQLAEIGRRNTATDYVRALQAMHRGGRQAARFFLDYDLLLTPTMAVPPFELGVVNQDHDFDDYWRELMPFMPFTPLYNMTGQPAMSVPLCWNREGLPIGSHFVGRFGDEATLFRLAAQLEEARPWAGRLPPACES